MGGEGNHSSLTLNNMLTPNKYLWSPCILNQTNQTDSLFIAIFLCCPNFSWLKTGYKTMKWIYGEILSACGLFGMSLGGFADCCFILFFPSFSWPRDLPLPSILTFYKALRFGMAVWNTSMVQGHQMEGSSPFPRSVREPAWKWSHDGLKIK